MNQYVLNSETVYSARFDKQDEDNRVLDETELFINLNNKQYLTESDLDIIYIKSPLEHQIKAQEMKDSGWRIDKINFMTVFIFKIGEMDGRSYVKIPLRTSAILNIENDDNYCFLWSILSYLLACNNNHPNRVSN